MGVGDPLEAATTLAGPIAAGSWHLVGDGLVLKAVDMQFDVIWRGGGGDHVLATFTHHFDPPSGFDAVMFEADATGLEAPAAEGDKLVLRLTATQAVDGPVWIPNADGKNTNGRIPSLRLP